MPDLTPENAADEIGLESLQAKNGALDMKFVANGENGEALMLAMSDAMGGMLDQHDATNYVEFTVAKRGRPTYVVCVRRHHRPTPHELRQKAEAELAEAREAIARVIAMCDEADRKGTHSGGDFTVPAVRAALKGTE